VLSVDVVFVRSAATASDFPRDGLAELAMVGRSNVGKSSLINALVQRSVARTSAAPVKTRLINLYRVTRAGLAPFYLVDLPGYGFARREPRSKANSAATFEALTSAYFQTRAPRPGARGSPVAAAALLLVDARHPGLPSDEAAWSWLSDLGRPAAVVATKIDKLARAERTRAQRALDLAFDGPVPAVSAASGEGLKELWKLIERLLSPSAPKPTARPR
jgi:GTP-binding protein